jgi:8-oxo-dGTP diphosphatase
VALIRGPRGILLTRRGRPPYAGTWDLPGGFLEQDEIPLEGLRRELREEIGVGIRRASFVGFASDRYGPGGVAVLTIVYRVTPTTRRVRAQDDVAEVRWFRVRDVPYREIAFTGVRRLLRRIFTPGGAEPTMKK